MMISKLKNLREKFFNKNKKETVNNSKKRNSVEKTIIVLGMHRSGTSLTTNVLENLGVKIGMNLLKPSKHNLKGYFENKNFVEINEEILVLAKGSWNNLPNHEKILSLKNNEKLMKKIQTIIRNNEDKIWGWKDPRTNLTINLFLPFIKNPHFIVCYRNPLSIARSLNKRDKLSIEKSLNLVSEYNKRLSNFLLKNKFPTIFINYEEFFINPKGQINKIKKFVEINKKVEISVVDKKLKHF